MDVTPIFKAPKQERARAWNSTLPAPTRRPSKPRKRIRPRTTRAAADDRTFKEGWRAVMCQRCGTRKATDASHRGSRAQRPDLRGDPSNRDDLCRPCHEWVEANADAARDEGWRDPVTYEAANADPMAKIRRQFEGG